MKVCSKEGVVDSEGKACGATRANMLRGAQVGTPVYFMPRLLTEVDWQVFSGCRPTDMPKELKPHIEPASLGTASFKSPARNGWMTCYAMPTLVPFLKRRSFSSSKAWWLTLRCLGSNMLRSSSARLEMRLWVSQKQSLLVDVLVDGIPWCCKNGITQLPDSCIQERPDTLAAFS